MQGGTPCGMRGRHPAVSSSRPDAAMAACSGSLSSRGAVPGRRHSARLLGSGHRPHQQADASWHRQTQPRAAPGCVHAEECSSTPGARQVSQSCTLQSHHHQQQQLQKVVIHMPKASPMRGRPSLLLRHSHTTQHQFHKQQQLHAAHDRQLLAQNKSILPRRRVAAAPATHTTLLQQQRRQTTAPCSVHQLRLLVCPGRTCRSRWVS